MYDQWSSNTNLVVMYNLGYGHLYAEAGETRLIRSFSLLLRPPRDLHCVSASELKVSRQYRMDKVGDSLLPWNLRPHCCHYQRLLDLWLVHCPLRLVACPSALPRNDFDEVERRAQFSYRRPCKTSFHRLSKSNTVSHNKIKIK